MLDSGTTMTYFEQDIYEQISKKIIKNLDKNVFEYESHNQFIILKDNVDLQKGLAALPSMYFTYQKK